MSDVNANDTRLIESCDEVSALYQGAGNNTMTGIEVELAFFDPASPDLTPMTIPQNETIKNATNAQCGGDFARNEPTSEMLEIGSIAAKPNELDTIITDTNRKIACLTQKAADIGLKRSFFQDLPDQTAQDLLKNVVDIPRYQAFFAPPRKDMMDVAAYFSVCKSNQISVSHRDPDHLLSNIRRLYYLAPFLFMIMDNGSGFNEAEAFSGHAGMHHRAALGTRGGCPDYVFTAQSGEEYIRAHINAVMNNPLFVYYDENGDLIRLPAGEWQSFNNLREKGLNTATNYYFAQTILWPDVKIAALKDEAENVTGHRFEARMIGVGMHQHISALLIIAGLAFNEEFAHATDTLLKSYGFDPQTPENTKANLTKAYKAAREHSGQFLNIPYGTGNMQNFAKSFANILEAAYNDSPHETALSPILHICRTGLTDAKINRIMFPTLTDAKNFQRTFDPEILQNTNLCTAQLFEDNTQKTNQSACIGNI
ncbi:MAG: hypothetical protein ACRBCT_05215 [Alphaproteobacteria bacterium]